MAMEEVSTQDTLYELGHGIDFKPRQETTLEDITLIKLSLSIITWQVLTPLSVSLEDSTPLRQSSLFFYCAKAHLTTFTLRTPKMSLKSSIWGDMTLMHAR